MVDQWMLPSFVHIYDEGTAATLDAGAIAAYVKGNLPPWTAVDARGEFFQWHLARFPEPDAAKRMDLLAHRLASIRVRNPDGPVLSIEPMRGEIDYERRWLESADAKPSGILYDGFELSSVLRLLLPGEEAGFDHVHIVFTQQLFGTREKGDSRYHARVGVYAAPCIISTTGVVEAPARPREFYLLKQQYSRLGFLETALPELKQHFKGRFIDYDDERLTEVMKGYAVQALFYHLTGYPFCDDPGCRLYNAHWQEELIYAQLKSKYELCPSHEEDSRRSRASRQRRSE